MVEEFSHSSLTVCPFDRDDEIEIEIDSNDYYMSSIVYLDRVKAIELRDWLTDVIAGVKT